MLALSKSELGDYRRVSDADESATTGWYLRPRVKRHHVYS